MLYCTVAAIACFAALMIVVAVVALCEKRLSGITDILYDVRRELEKADEQHARMINLMCRMDGAVTEYAAGVRELPDLIDEQDKCILDCYQHVTYLQGNVDRAYNSLSKCIDMLRAEMHEGM